MTLAERVPDDTGRATERRERDSDEPDRGDMEERLRDLAYTT